MRTPPNERVNPDIAERRAPELASGSERRCILSGETAPRAQLIRLAIAPSGEVLPDPAAKAPGRGAWIAPDKAALESAMGDGHLKRALVRSFKGGPTDHDGHRLQLQIGDDLPGAIAAGLTRHLLDRLGLEWRGGNIVLGSSRIAEHARTGRIGLLLHASDASEDGRRKLDQAWRVGLDQEGSGKRGIVLPLDRDTLSVALGRANVVHLGVSGAHNKGGNGKDAASRVGQAVTRLTRFLGNDPPG